MAFVKVKSKFLVMKKINLLILLLMLSGASVFSQLQQIKIVSFTVKNQLPATIDKWSSTPGSLLLVAQLPPTVRVKGIKLMIQIRANGAIVCSNNAAGGLQVDEFTTRSFSANELTSTLQGCSDLKDGSYTICAQFFNVDRVAISNEVCKEFTVETPKPTDYAPPTLINPDNGKDYSSDELSRPVTFRWTPIVPKPREPVTYRLKVWQLMAGQNAMAAMRTNQPIITKDVDNITQVVVSNIYTGPCKPPMICSFVWQVQAFNKEGKPIGRNEGNSEPYTFKAEEKATTGTLRNSFPEDKKQFTPEEAGKPITFKWTPLSPKPQEPVTYRVRVWQLMQGQNAMGAMRSNQPIVTKEVNNVTEMAAGGIYTGPCRPPMICAYVWAVEAVTKNAAGVTRVIATSEPTSFFVTQYIIQIDSIKVLCTSKPGVYSFSYFITNPNPGPAIFSLFTVTSSVPAGATIVPGFAPPIGTIIPSGGQITVTGTINAATNLSNICIGARITDQGNSFWMAQKDTCAKVEPCKCEECDKVKINVVQKELKFDNKGNVILNTNVSSSPKLVKSIKAELVYFEYKPESDDCMLCNKDSKTFGNFNNGTRSMEWNFSPPKNISNGSPTNMLINVPPTVNCCNANIKFCIRYVITYEDCTVCNKLVCYEIKKDGCKTSNSNPNSDQK